MKKLVIALGVAAGVVLAGCTADPNGGAGDAPIGDVVTDAHWVIINAPDRYPNVAFTCRGKVGVYTSRKGDNGGGAIAVVADDPNCQDR